MATTFRVVVVGGGYAGVMAANRLRQRSDLDIALVNPRPKFVERIRLHQLVTGSDDAVEDYPTILADDVRLIVDSVERIDADAHRLHLASGATLEYDYLVYAVGSTAPAPASVPGATDSPIRLVNWKPRSGRTACRRADVRADCRGRRWPDRYRSRR